jgi:hypothetical protein
MIEHHGPDAVVNIRPSIENTVPCRQVPSDDLPSPTTMTVLPVTPRPQISMPVSMINRGSPDLRSRIVATLSQTVQPLLVIYLAKIPE